MYSYAQSNIQLFNRMRAAEYSQAEIIAVRDAYRCAINLFACRFEPSGRVFIVHVVRTAGILVELRAPAPVVVAGLLHNAYQNGDFGDGVPGLTPSKRELIRKVVGGEAESYIAGFSNQAWGAAMLRALREELERDGFESILPVKRNVILLRIADHLEHKLDCEPLYVSQNRYQDLMRDAGSELVKIAELLHYPTLATELRRAAEKLETATVATELCTGKTRSELFIPASCCMRFPAQVRSFYFRARRRLAPLRQRYRAALAGKASQ